MANMYEQWRAADGEADAAQLLIRTLGRHSNYETVPDHELRRASDLRARADKLFVKAAHEVSDEVHDALRRRAERPSS
jgi:hypothetical protein